MMRTVAGFLFCALTVAAPPLAAAEAPGASAQLLVQSSALAGFRYYEAGALWDEMQVGDKLDLVREPDNPYDSNAVRVDWRGRRLGYVPRRDNRKVAQNLDRGVKLEARISKKQPHRSPSQRIEFEIYLGL